jgi:WD40 repeat protein
MFSLLDRWWDLRTRALTTSLAFPGPITSMELSPQTKRLVVTSGKTVAFIPALPNGSATHSLTLPYSPSSASIHPIMQDRFVTGNSGDEWVRVHGMDGEEREVLKGHHGPVHCVEFSPDGEMYASGSGKRSHYLFYSRPLTPHDAVSRFIPHQRMVGVPKYAVTREYLLSLRRNHPPLADDTWQDIWSLARPNQRRLDLSTSNCSAHQLSLSYGAFKLMTQTRSNAGFTSTEHRMIFRCSEHNNHFWNQYLFILQRNSGDLPFLDTVYPF